ncbi:MAG: hypothetical protein ACP5RW_00745 [bacterium]
MISPKIYLLLYVVILLLLSSPNPLLADRASVSPEPISLSQDFQRAIIMHNSEEEILILGTELKAGKDTDILEFIPFPSEPDVKLAVGDPFKEIERLMVEEKGIALIDRSIFKGGGGEASPVEIKLSEKIGLHDVTVIKINDISGFTQWVEKFFNRKGIKVSSDLSGFYRNAEDYVKRGINYFVFDYVSIKTETHTIEPLVYRFKTVKLYYPLKTSNIIGGSGIVDLIFISPGSFSQMDYFRFSDDLRNIFELSNSVRVYPDELEKIYPGASGFFSKIDKIYIQMMRYNGPYNFSQDFLYDVSKLDPRSYAWENELIFGYDLIPVDNEEEYRRNSFYEYPYFTDFECDVYSVVLTSKEFMVTFPRKITLGQTTIKKRLDIDLVKQWGRAVIEDFNIKNERTYNLDEYWMSRVQKGNPELGIDFNKTADEVIYLSRVGFNMNHTKAIVYAEKVTNKTTRTGYLIILGRKNRDERWNILSCTPVGTS